MRSYNLPILLTGTVLNKNQRFIWFLYMKSFQARQFGKFLLLDKAAVGGMAELYRAKIIGDRGFEKIVAIKKLLPHLSLEENLVTAFIDEAKLAAILQHQNIVQIYDFGTMEESYFIAMEFLTGKDLRRTTNQSKRKKLFINLETALYITAQICEGLHYAHNLRDFQGKPLGIIHRDISPPNILITYSGMVKVIDFGIAKARNQSVHTQVGIIKGKVAYMSPEQAEGKVIDHRSDIFATGILLYEMLARRRMFNGEDTFQVLSQVREARFEPLEKIINCEHPELFAILNRALGKDPDQRYPTSGEMLADIEKLLYQLPGRPTPQSISSYMHALFSDEIQAEERDMRLAMQVDVREALGRPEESLNDSRKIINAGAQEKTKPFQLETEDVFNGTALMDTDEIAGKVKRLGLWYAGIAIVVFVIALSTVFIFRGSFLSRAKYADKRQLTHDQLKAGLTALDEKHFSEAAQTFKALYAQNPAMKKELLEPYTRALLGQAAELAESNPGQAEKLLLRAVQLNPENMEGLFQLGLLYVKQQNYGKALPAFNKAAKLNPQHPNTYYNLGYIYAKRRDYAKAEQMFKRTVALSPPFLDEALFNLAIVQRKIGKRNEFIKNLELALKANPDNKPAKRYLERIKRKQ